VCEAGGAAWQSPSTRRQRTCPLAGAGARRLRGPAPHLKRGHAHDGGARQHAERLEPRLAHREVGVGYIHLPLRVAGGWGWGVGVAMGAGPARGAWEAAHTCAAPPAPRLPAHTAPAVPHRASPNSQPRRARRVGPHLMTTWLMRSTPESTALARTALEPDRKKAHSLAASSTMLTTGGRGRRGGRGGAGGGGWGRQVGAQGGSGPLRRPLRWRRCCWPAAAAPAAAAAAVAAAALRHARTPRPARTPRQRLR
jgi:hypothetical protein